MLRVNINPEMLRWARARSRVDSIILTKRFPKLPAWEAAESQPTFRQLEDFARATYTPIGFLFLSQPPVEEVPIPDFRTIADQSLLSPSPNLLDTIYLCQQRQSWFKDYATIRRFDQIDFIGTASVTESPATVAQRIVDRLDFPVSARKTFSGLDDTLRAFASSVEEAGVLVMRNGVVGNNTHRKLDPSEFRGFALCDSIAPLIFVNGADSKSAQMFTLAHEVAHLFLGESALTNSDISVPDAKSHERWCNEVAAEFLVPIDLLRTSFSLGEPLGNALARLKREYRVSSIVLLRRLLDASMITTGEYREQYKIEVDAFNSVVKKSEGGGDFYLSQAVRSSKRFARALIESTLEGHTLYRDAMKMLGIAKTETFNEFGRTFGYPL
jgi:Zn-dependent peptidase ImmA (M78 family)